MPVKSKYSKKKVYVAGRAKTKSGNPGNILASAETAKIPIRAFKSSSFRECPVFCLHEKKLSIKPLQVGPIGELLTHFGVQYGQAENEDDERKKGKKWGTGYKEGKNWQKWGLLLKIE